MMIIKKLPFQLMKVEKREGTTGPNNKGYLFYVGKFLDEDGDLLNLKFQNKLTEDTQLALKLLAVKNVPVTVDLGLHPAGFDLKGVVTKIDF